MSRRLVKDDDAFQVIYGISTASFQVLEDEQQLEHTSSWSLFFWPQVGQWVCQ